MKMEIKRINEERERKLIRNSPLHVLSLISTIFPVVILLLLFTLIHLKKEKNRFLFAFFKLFTADDIKWQFEEEMNHFQGLFTLLHREQ
jgi:uncharacterized BrkB/YihY/UPF0761 family membrane protein